MANPHKGEVEFEVDGFRHVLSFSANALCELEVALGRDIDSVIESMRTGKIKLADMRVMFWAALLDCRPEATMDDAKAILRTLPPAEMGRLVGQAFLLSMPAVEESEGSHGNPPKPGGQKRGTGPAS